jgi:hypothetical protein
MKPRFHKMLILDKEKSLCPMFYKGQKLKESKISFCGATQIGIQKIPAQQRANTRSPVITARKARSSYNGSAASDDPHRSIGKRFTSCLAPSGRSLSCTRALTYS